MQPKKHKIQTQGPTGLYELFLLTAPIEEVACWQYKTVLLMFPLDLQTITINSDADKWRKGGDATSPSLWDTSYKVSTFRG